MPVQRKPLRSSGALLTGEVSRISPFRELQPGGRGARLAVTVGRSTVCTDRGRRRGRLGRAL
jgi:hypothetical protein